MGSPKSTALLYGKQQQKSRSLWKIIMASLISLLLLALILFFSVSSVSSHSKHASSSTHSSPKTTTTASPPHPSATPPPIPKTTVRTPAPAPGPAPVTPPAPAPVTSPAPAPSPLRSFPADVAEVRLACKATRFPDTCRKSLSKRVPSGPTPTEVIQAAISVSAENLQTAKEMVVSIRDSSAGNKNLTTAAEICLQQLDYSHYRTNSAAEALPRGKTKDARAWFSAALAYQYDCWGGFKYVNDTKLVVDTMSFLDSLMGLTSNALSMTSSFHNYGSDFDKWQAPRTERDGVWEKVEAGAGVMSGFDGGVPSDLEVKATVCKLGDCDYKTVHEAVNAAPKNDSDGKFVIHIKAGTYEERVRVPFDRKNVVILGDGIGKTVITGSANVGQLGMTTYESATVGMSFLLL